MQGQELLAQGLPRYPLAVAACWIAGCGIVAAAAGAGVRTEPFYLPAIVALAWYYGPRHGLLAALGAAISASVAEVTTGPGMGPAVLAWNFAARGLLFALPAGLAFALRDHQRRLAGLVTTDAQTGFATRHGLLGAIADELARTERLGGDMSIVCIGLNGLPRLAAERGRAHEDALLRGFCDALSSSARRTDLVARLAEDEFALLLRGTGRGAAADTADKLAQSLTGWLLTQGNDLACSVGFTTAPRGRLLDAAALLARAVAHMYEQRSAGAAPPVARTPRAGAVSSLRGAQAAAVAQAAPAQPRCR